MRPAAGTGKGCGAAAGREGSRQCLIPDPGGGHAPSSGKAQLFAERDYGGAVTTLEEEGIYHPGTSTAAGANGTVSSLKVAPGYTLTVYSGNNCQGASATFTADTANVGDVFNDVIRSVEVSARTTSAEPDWFEEGKAPDWFKE